MLELNAEGSLTADDILRWMGNEFVSLRQKHPRKAWTFYRDALMQYQCELREAISLESIIERAMKIETFVQDLREVAEKHELTPTEALEGMRIMLRPRRKPDGPPEEPPEEKTE